MLEREISLDTGDGTMPAFVVHPDRGGPFPVVLMYMDGLGMREALHDLARRLATSGYYVLLPNLYYRDGVTEPIGLDTPDAMARIMALVRKVTPAGALRDSECCLRFAAGDPAARPGAAGVMGYCMGGRLAVVAAQALGARIGAAVSIHPGFLDDALPALLATDLRAIRGAVYVAAADNDPTFTDEQRTTLDRALRAAGAPFEIELHRGATHGYFVPGERLEKAHAERTWSRALALLRTPL
ncbi:MAG: dienelactone hydrolase family protein [Gammaproteobacteria bacterium]